VQDRERQSQEREIKVFAGIRAFIVPKRSVLQKKKKVYAELGASSCPEMKRSPNKRKRSFLDLGVFLSQKWLRIQVSGGGAKVAQGGQNISRGSSCPPTSSAYAHND